MAGRLALLAILATRRTTMISIRVADGCWGLAREDGRTG